MRVVSLFAFCSGCVVAGETYGGGDGLTLSTPAGSTTFPGATQSELRSEEPGVASVYVPSDAEEGWVVRVQGDAFTADDVVEALGLPCPSLATGYTVVVTPVRVELHYTDGIGTSDAYGEAGDITGDALGGAAQQTLGWGAMIDGCTADLPAQVSAAWSFDPAVHTVVRGGPSFEIPGDLQLER